MAFYFDTFNRANSTTTPGTSDSGHTYSTQSPKVDAGISSSALYQPSGSTTAWAIPNVTAREFDVTITVGAIASGNPFTFFFNADTAITEALSVVVADTGVTLSNTDGDTISTGATAVTAASTVRIRRTKKDVTVWVGSTKQFTTDTTRYNENGTFFFAFTAGTTATVGNVTMSMPAQSAVAESTMLSDLRNLIYEPSASNSNFSDAELLRYMNQELAWIGAQCPVVTRTYTFSGVGDDNGEWELPEDITAIDTVEKNEVVLHRINFDGRNSQIVPNLLRNYLNTGDAGYWIRGRRIGFNPELTASDSVIVYYRPNLAALVESTDIPEFPVYFGDSVLHGAAKRCYLKAQDSEGASTHAGIAKEAFREARTIFNRTQSTGRINIRQ